MAKNYYVVLNGRNPGIYKTWNECKVHVEGFKGAKFKGFSSSSEVQEYIKGSKLETSLNETNGKENQLVTNIGVSAIASVIKSAEPTFSKSKQKYVSKTSLKRKAEPFSDTSATMIKKSRNGDMEFLYEREEADRVCVYTDGSCKKSRRGQIAGYGVYWGPGSPLNVGEKYVGVQTNNRAEIAAVIRAVETATTHGIGKLAVLTDSQFTINCMTKWIKAWKKNDWMLSSTGKPCVCRDVLEQLDKLIADTKIDIKWRHVRAHQGDLGNEAADTLANQGADQWLTDKTRKK